MRKLKDAGANQTNPPNYLIGKRNSMEGTIEPAKTLIGKFNKIGEAPKLEATLTAGKEIKVLVASNILASLIASNKKFSGDDAMINRAISLSEKLLKAIEKNIEEKFS